MKVRYLSQPTVASIKVGQVLYYAHGLGAGSFLNEGIVVREPYSPIQESCGPFIDVQETNKYGTFVNNWSLKDMSVVPNTYNIHKAFYHKADAEKYVAECKTMFYDSHHFHCKLGY